MRDRSIHTDTADRGVTALLLRIGLHLLFWLAAMGISYLFYARLLESGEAALFVLLYTLPVYVAAVYVTTGITIPRALLPRRYGRVFFYVAYTVLGIFFVEMLLSLLLLLDAVPVPHLAGYEPPRNAIDIVLLSTGVYVVTLMASVLSLLRHWYASDRRTQRLRQERLTAELAMLRSQVHPHFLFNTLNNLYALTLQKSDRAPEVVLKLSELLDYMLYESRADTVPVEREATLLTHYLDLERMRHGPGVRIDWRSDLQVPQRIIPLLLLPLVENCFKHGVSRSGEGAWVELALSSTSSDILFTARNSLPAGGAEPATASENGSGGIGLRNVQERLRLHYAGRSSFSAEIRDGVYDVRLSISFLTFTASDS